MTAEGTFPKSDGDVLYASEVNRFESSRWRVVKYTDNFIALGILKGSGTNLCIYNGTSSAISSDNGDSWTACSADIADMTGQGVSCTANKDYMIIADHNSANISISSDSGDNWASATTDPAGVGAVNALSFPTTGIAIAGTAGGASRQIYRSTDAGDTWTVCTSGPTNIVYTLAMYDGTYGAAIDGATTRIWLTSDGGDNWTDTTHTSGQVPTENIIHMLTATTFLAIENTGGVIYYDGTGNASVVFNFGYALTNIYSYLTYPTNFVETSNGNIYFCVVKANDTGANGYSTTVSMYKSEDNGLNWSVSELPTFSSVIYSNINTYNTSAYLVEKTDNVLLLTLGGVALLEINESGT